MKRLFVLVMTLLATVAGAVPSQITLTARLADAGSPLNGSHTVIVRMHGALTGGLPTWTETHLVTVTDGLLFLTLGSQTPLDSTIIDGTPLFAEIQVDSTVLSPRLALVSVPYAVRSGVAENSARLGGSLPSDYALVNHVHAGLYLPLGPVLQCTGTDKVVGLSSNGSVVCAPDQSGSALTAGLGLILAGSSLSVAFAGTGVATSAARSDHAHTGTYLPMPATLVCPVGRLVSGLQSDGSLTCATANSALSVSPSFTAALVNGAPQLQLSFAGTGVNLSAARSDHTHSGTYLPLGTSLSCPTGQRVAAIDSGGSVVCSTTTIAVAATQSLTSVTNNGIAVIGVNFGGTGSSLNPARADHTHTAVCPTGYATHGGTGVASPLCVKRVAQANVQWGDAVTACYVDHAGGQLCTYNELRIAFSTPPAETQVIGYWMADRVDDDWVLRLNTNNNTTNFDEKVEISSTAVPGPGYYCCQRAQ